MRASAPLPARSIASGGLSGLLAALALPPTYLWPLAFVALVPWGWALRHPESEDPRRGAALGGIAFGVAFYGPLLPWVPGTLHGLLPLGAVTGLLSLLLLAMVSGGQGVLLDYLLRTRAHPPLLILPAVWVSTEVALASLGPLAFPWTPLALALAGRPDLAAPAEWIGAGGLTLWIALVNGALLGLLPEPRGPQHLGAQPSDTPRSFSWARSPLALLLLTPLLVSLAGGYRIRTLPIDPLGPILVARLDLSREELLDPLRRSLLARESLDRVLTLASVLRDGPGGRARLLLLPEAPTREPWSAEDEEWLREGSVRLGVPILVGAQADPAANVLRRMDGDGTSSIVHVKERLIPLVEWPSLRSGDPPEAIEVGGLRVGVMICFEAGFGSGARSSVRDGAELLLHPSNDGWFVPLRPVQEQIIAHLVLRAIETRTAVVRATIGGEVLMVDPLGEVRRIESAGEGVYRLHPDRAALRTLYLRVGDLGARSGLLLLLGLLLTPPFRIPQQRSPMTGSSRVRSA